MKFKMRLEKLNIKSVGADRNRRSWRGLENFEVEQWWKKLVSFYSCKNSSCLLKNSFCLWENSSFIVYFSMIIIRKRKNAMVL